MQHWQPTLRCRSPRHSSDDERTAEERLAEGTLISHLVELRQRLLKCVIAIAIVFAPCAWFANDLFTIIATPLISKMPAGSLDDRHQSDLAIHGAAEAVAVRRGVHRDAVHALPGVGVRRAGPVQAREALRDPAGGVEHRVVLRRRRVRLLRRSLSADVRVPDQRPHLPACRS